MRSGKADRRLDESVHIRRTVACWRNECFFKITSQGIWKCLQYARWSSNAMLSPTCITQYTGKFVPQGRTCKTARVPPLNSARMLLSQRALVSCIRSESIASSSDNEQMTTSARVVWPSQRCRSCYRFSLVMAAQAILPFWAQHQF